MGDSPMIFGISIFLEDLREITRSRSAAGGDVLEGFWRNFELHKVNPSTENNLVVKIRSVDG